jgi:hypothetical protein
VRWRRSLLRNLSSLCRVWRRKSWRVRLLVRTLTTSLLTRVWGSSGLRGRDMSMRRSLLHVAWRHRIDWWALRRVALRRIGVLRWRVGIAMLLGRERLTISSVKLLWLCTLLSPDGMRRDECLRLGRDGCEDALLRETLAVGTATILRLIKTRASNLECVRRSIAEFSRQKHTFLRRQ